MIDCTKTTNYFSEKKRMGRQASGVCKLRCTDCPMGMRNNGIGVTCSDFESSYPEQAIEVVQRWSNAYPQKTFLTELLENYPNAELDHGVPKICLKKLGAVSGCAKTKKGDLYISCYSCWNQPIEDGEE